METLKKFFNTFFNNDDKLRKHFIILTLILFIALIILSIFISSKKPYITLSVDDTVVGVINENYANFDLDTFKDDIFDYATEVQEENIHITYPKYTTSYSDVAIKPDNLMEYDELVHTATSYCTISYIAYGVFVDGTLVGGPVRVEDDLYTILDDVKAIYEVPQLDGTITDVEFSEAIQIKELISKDKSYVEPEVVFDALRETVVVEKTHIVEEGDSLWQIAYDNDLSLDTLMLNNPGVAEGNYLQIGDSIILENEKPRLSVVSTEQIEYNDVSYRTIETVENNEEFKTWSNIITEGSDGESKFTVDISYLDGKEVARTVVNEEVIVPSVTKVIEVGTLDVPPKKAIGTFIWPASGRISDYFGARGGNHYGLDIAVPTGTPVAAIDGGYVEFTGWQSGYGYLVIIDHENGYKSYYAHNSRFQVSQGERVRQGQIIASAGSTGRSTGPHVHLEIRIDGVPHNPLNYLGEAYQ
ncbi:MAG: peptidoglycan DD-metalloendopeptidase family protein [Lachnospirales bacterium]